MKKTIKHFFPLILTALCALFGLSILFHGFSNSPNGIFTEIGGYFLNHTQTDNLTLVAKQVETEEKRPLPIPQYIGGTLTVGEANAFDSLFTLKFPNGTITSIDAESTTALYLLDVTYSNASSALMKLSEEDINALDELPSAAIYDTDNRLLYFNKGGIYTLYMRLYFDYRPGVLFECQVPVEVG